MNWITPQVIHQLEQLIESPPSGSGRSVAIVGDEGSGKSELVNYLFDHLSPELYFAVRYDFSEKPFPLENFFEQLLKENQRHQRTDCNHFLQLFSEDKRRHIEEVLQGRVEVPGNRAEWMRDLFLHFTSWLSERKKILLALENIHLATVSELAEAKQIVQQLNSLAGLVLYSFIPEKLKKNVLDFDQTVLLPKLSVKEVEERVRKYFSTDPFNARLITNQCYLKSRGNPQRIRFMLEGLYRPLLEESESGTLDIRKLRKVRVPDDWEALSGLVFRQLSPQEQQFLAMLAQLNSPLLEEDFRYFVRQLELPEAAVERWFRSGLLLKKNQGEYAKVVLAFLPWKTWLKQHVSFEMFKPLLDSRDSRFWLADWTRKYRFSHLFYECGETNLAVQLAEREAFYLKEIGNPAEAADRFYFLVRLHHLFPDLIPNIRAILEALGEVYLQLGAQENAFEIYRYLRELHQAGLEKNHEESVQAWLNASIEMARALVAMDAYQEARYLLREVLAKKILPDELRAEGFRLYADIEWHTGKKEHAVERYRNAQEIFQKVGNERQVYEIYRRIKQFLRPDTAEQLEYVSQTLHSFDPSRNRPEYGFLLRDRIQLLLNQGDYLHSIKDCLPLWRVLRRHYLPRLEIQLGFYFSEIHAFWGKWKYALGHIRRLIKENYVAIHPFFRAQSYIQLGVLEKEQAFYHSARDYFEKGLQICQENHFIEQANEIKIQLGHLYLSIHAIIRARDYLWEAHRWAQRHQHFEHLRQSRLYLSHLALQKGDLSEARRWLKEARPLIEAAEDRVDFLNYLYYFILYLIHQNDLEKAKTLTELLIQRAGELTRYRLVGQWLLVKIYLASSQLEKAEKFYEQARELRRRLHLMQVEYLFSCEGARLAHLRQKQALFRERLREACGAIQELLARLDDPIMEAQFLESRDHADIVQWCKEADWLKK